MTRSRLVVEVEDLEVIKQEVARAMQSRNSKLILCPFCFFDKIDHPFCLQNCFFLFATHFAQILLSKFCQGLDTTGTNAKIPGLSRSFRDTWRLYMVKNFGTGCLLHGKVPQLIALPSNDNYMGVSSAIS